MKWYVMTITKYAQFNGRSRRSEFWYFQMFNILFASAFGFFDGIAGNLDTLGWRHFYTLFILLPSLAVAVRRMHDVNKSGWYALIPFYSILFSCTGGTKGTNQYGENSKRN